LADRLIWLPPVAEKVLIGGIDAVDPVVFSFVLPHISLSKYIAQGAK